MMLPILAKTLINKGKNYKMASFLRLVTVVLLFIICIIQCKTLNCQREILRIQRVVNKEVMVRYKIDGCEVSKKVYDSLSINSFKVYN